MALQAVTSVRDRVEAEREAKDARQHRFNRNAGLVALAVLLILLGRTLYGQGHDSGYTEGAREGAEVCCSYVASRFEDGTDWREVVAELQDKTFCEEALAENGVIP